MTSAEYLGVQDRCYACELLSVQSPLKSLTRWDGRLAWAAFAMTRGWLLIIFLAMSRSSLTCRRHAKFSMMLLWRTSEAQALTKPLSRIDF